MKHGNEVSGHVNECTKNKIKLIGNVYKG
jgi:hypothetical protein